MNIFIYQHLGLGDMISNNGLIRYLIDLNPKTKFFYIFCKKMHKKSINFMFRDLKKVKIIFRFRGKFDFFCVSNQKARH